MTEIKTGYITVNAMPYIDVSISGSIDNWNFQTGNNEDTTAVDLTVDTNMNSWSVGVMDALTESKPGERQERWLNIRGVPMSCPVKFWQTRYRLNPAPVVMSPSPERTSPYRQVLLLASHHMISE